MSDSHENKSQTTEEQTEILPEAPATLRVLDYLLRNAHGIGIEEVINEFSLSESGVRSTLGRIRAKKGNPYQITVENKIISVKIRGRWPTETDILNNVKNGNYQIGRNPGYNFHKRQGEVPEPPPDSLTGNVNYDQIVDLLRSNPDGVKSSDILEELEISSQYLYNSVYAIRKKGINIVFSNGIYYLKNGKPKARTSGNRYKYKNNEIVKAHPRLKINNFIPPEYKEAFENLPDKDKVECINLIKKSTYYKNAAIALMEANQTAFDFCSTLTNGGF